MPPEELTTSAAWLALCEARHGRAAPSAEASDLRLAGDGSWQARGPVEDQARTLLDCLAPLAVHRGPLVIGQLGQSLDGRIATASGHSHYINGLDSRVHLHRLRALVDAVVVGAGTATEDDPQLTVRHVEGPQPVRVILDPRGRVPAHTGLLRDPAAPTLHLVAEGAVPAANVGAHVHRMVIPCGPDGAFAPAVVLQALADRGLTRVLVEGGGVTVSRFLEAGVLHRLHLLVAPLLIGSGRPGLSLTPITTLDEALRPRMRHFTCGDDSLFDLILA